MFPTRTSRTYWLIAISGSGVVARVASVAWQRNTSPEVGILAPVRSTSRSGRSSPGTTAGGVLLRAVARFGCVLEPGLLPEDPALRLAAPVTGAVAARLPEQDRIGHPPAPGALAQVVADLFEPPVDRHRAPRVGRHLGHERNTLE